MNKIVHKNTEVGKLRIRFQRRLYYASTIFLLIVYVSAMIWLVLS
jgi:hypothetical protein